jgi:hypothetical protein
MMQLLLWLKVRLLLLLLCLVLAGLTVSSSIV